MVWSYLILLGLGNLCLLASDVTVLGDVWLPRYFRVYKYICSFDNMDSKGIKFAVLTWFGAKCGGNRCFLKRFSFFVNCYWLSSYREQDCIGALIFHLTFGIHRLLTFPVPSLGYSRRKGKMPGKSPFFNSLGLSITSNLLSSSFRTVSYLK